MSECDDPNCKGWAHFNDPHEIERCDECARFAYDEEAVLAHRKECGCDWPEAACRKCGGPLKCDEKGTPLPCAAEGC